MANIIGERHADDGVQNADELLSHSAYLLYKSESNNNTSDFIPSDAFV